MEEVLNKAGLQLAERKETTAWILCRRQRVWVWPGSWKSRVKPVKLPQPREGDWLRAAFAELFRG